MMRVIRIFLGLALIAFIGYLFFSGHIAGAIIVIIGSGIIIPLAMHMTNGGQFSGSPKQDSTPSSSPNGSGGAHGGGYE